MESYIYDKNNNIIMIVNKLSYPTPIPLIIRPGNNILNYFNKKYL